MSASLSTDSAPWHIVAILGILLGAGECASSMAEPFVKRLVPPRVEPEHAVWYCNGSLGWWNADGFSCVKDVQP